ncbi:MAG: DUF1592 domain-containing protein [Pirellulales bacterium]
MRTLAVVCLLVTCLGGSVFAATDTAPAVAFDRAKAAFLQAHCLKCHGDKADEGIPRLDTIPYELATLEAAERWQRVLAVMNSGEMPPADEHQPPAAEKTEFLASLSATLVQARKALGDQGRVGLLRRLNRREYVNTIQDLLGVQTDAEGLPDDKGTGTFDTIGSSLFISSDQLEAYLAVARAAVSAALAEMRAVTAPPETKRVRRETEVAYNAQLTTTVRRLNAIVAKLHRWRLNGEKPDLVELLGTQKTSAPEAEAKFIAHRSPIDFFYVTALLAMPKTLEGSYLGNASFSWHPSNEMIVIPKTAPPGDYVLRARLGTADAALNKLDKKPPPKPGEPPAPPQFVEIVVLEDGDNNRPRVIAVEEVTGTLDAPQEIEIRVHLTPGSQRHFAIREKRFSDGGGAGFKHGEEIREGNAIGDLPSIWCDWVEWEGPAPSPATAARRLELLGSAEVPAETEAVAREILTRFATRAFRGVAPDRDFVDRLIAIQRQPRPTGGDFLDSLVEPMAIILSSPGFLYLNEPLTAQAATDADRQLSDIELASRLSYLLWAGPPDEPLLAVARAGELRKPEVLASQVDRMVADPRSLRFVIGFVHQWLVIDRLDFFQFDYKNYPGFDESTRDAARQEVYRTCHLLLQEDLDARRLLKNDFVVVNSLLASHYGLTDGGKPVTGMAYRKVSLPEKSERGGLIGMAAILAMGSNGSHTSPVERGAWVLRKLLNDPPPPAPANVPQLSRLEGQKLTVRERLLAHQEQPQCAQCHRRIDPIGFGLENFDAAGLWRTVDTYKPGEHLKKDAAGKLLVATYPIDPAGAFYGGPAFADFFELRDRIADHGDGFLRGLVENLYDYALGRPVSFADAEAIDSIVAAGKAKGGGFKAIVKQLVATPEFQTK